MSRTATMRSFSEADVFNGAVCWCSVGRTDIGQVPHSHGFVEVEVVTGGSGVHVCEQGRKQLRLGDLVVLRPGAWHAYENCDGLILANLSIARFATSATTGALTQYEPLRELLWTRPNAAGQFGTYLTAVPDTLTEEVNCQVLQLRESLEQQPGNAPLIMGRLLTVLGTLVGELMPNETASVPHPAVTTIINQLVDYPERRWSLSELARLVSLDPSYLSRLMRHHTGFPPIAYLSHIRAERAAGLLAQTDEAIGRVGALVGWPDPAYFTRRFEAILGVTPREHRRLFHSPTPGVRPDLGAPPAEGVSLTGH